MLDIGLIGTATIEVTNNNTAKTVGSGSLDVFATPSMIALMEKAACNALLEKLEEGSTTVGTRIDISHVAATPVGMNAVCTATLTQIDGRKLVFDVVVEDEKEIIGKGVHERFIVAEERFMTKANSKKG